MNITLNIPINDNVQSTQLKELQKELTSHAMAWINKYIVSKTKMEDKLFEMPKEFETLRGSVSLDKIEMARTDDPMLDAMMEKYK